MADQSSDGTDGPDDSNPDSWVDGLPISRRRVIQLSAMGALAGAGATQALDVDGESGTVWGGTMALGEAFKVASGDRDWYQGPDSAKANIDAQTGDRYSATDVQIEYYYDGGSWVALGTGTSGNKAPASHFQSIDAGSVGNSGSDVPIDDNLDLQSSQEIKNAAAVTTDDIDVNTFDRSQTSPDGVLGITGNPDAIQLRNEDDAGTTAEQRSRITFFNDSYETLASIAGDIGDGEISIYTRDSAFGSGTNSITKRLDIGAGSDNVQVRWENISAYIQNGAVSNGIQGTFRIGADANQDTVIQFYEDGSEAGHVKWNANSGVNSAGQLVMNNLATNGARIHLEDTLIDMHETVRIRTDINMNGNALRGIRQGSNLSASDLEDGELVFDDNRENTGTAALLFRENDNTTHYVDFDATVS